MGVEVKLFWMLAAFFLPVGIIYGFATDWSEPVGVTGLFLCTLLGAMISYYLWFTARRLDRRPEDNPSAMIEDQEGDYGFFSPHSWWPLPLAGAGAICFLGLAVGWWLFIIGVTVGVVAIVGWTFEYYKGEHAV